MYQAPAFAVVHPGYLPRAYHCLPTFPLCSESRALGSRCQGVVESECGQEQIQSQKLGTANQFVIQRATETGASCKCTTVVLYLKTEPTQIHRKPYRRDRIPLLTWQLPVSTADPPPTSQMCFQCKICGFTQPQWHKLANELWRLDRRKAVDIVLLPSPVQQNICWGRLCCFHLITLCGLWATTMRQAKGRPPHGSKWTQKVFTQPHIQSLKKTLLTRRAQWGSQPVFIASMKIPGSFPLFVCERKMHLSHSSQSQAPSFPQVLRDTPFSISTFPE